jgi:hypothetical protein
VSANTEAVERIIRAFERGDVEAALAELDPEVEMLPLRAELEGTHYRGHDGYRQVLADFEGDWDELRLPPEEIREVGDQVLVTGRMRAKGKKSGVELDVPMAMLYTLRDGKIVRLQSFSDPEEGLRAAGIEL